MLTAVLDTHLNTFHLDIKFSAGKGKTTVLLGESGAGKSTVLRLLAGLLHPERGHISLEGKPYFDSERRIAIPPQERPLGYVRQELRNLLSSAGITTVMVTHQYLEALLFGYHILVLEQGHVIQQGSHRDLLQYPRSSYVAELVGMNFFRGCVICCEAGAMCTIQLHNNGRPGIEVRAALEERAQKL